MGEHEQLTILDLTVEYELEFDALDLLLIGLSIVGAFTLGRQLARLF